MAKSSPRKSLKSLFSRSEANLSESVEKDVDKNEGEKKKFKFLKFKIKSKNGSSSEKPAHEDQQVPSAVEPSKTVEDGEAWADPNVAEKKRFSLYGTAPRSKSKELSYSEMDLRKPKRFATFSFGLKRRKKKDEENMSKSTFVLHSPGIEEQNETPLDISQMELDQANTKKMFSMSQPELDTSDTFDIPSPPPVSTNQSDSYFTFSNQSRPSVAVNAQPEAKEPLTNSSDHFDGYEVPQIAPVATIPELQLDNPSEEKENIPVHDNSVKIDSNSSASSTHAETTSAVDNQTIPILPASLPPIVPDTSDHKAAVVDSVCTTNGLCDNNNSLAESTRVTLSHHQPDAPETADSTTPDGKLILASADSEIDITITESTPVPQTDNSALSADSASFRQEVSISSTERSVPKTAKSVATTSAVSGEKSPRPVSQAAVYGALYDSLFPQNFTSEVLSSLTNPPPQIRTEIRHDNAKLEPVMVKTLNESCTETNVMYSRPSASREFDSAAGRMDYAAGGYTNTNSTFSKSEVISSSGSSRFTSYQTSTAYEPPRDLDVHHIYLPSSLKSGSELVNSDNIPYSELTRSISEMKSGSVSLIQDTVPVVHNSAPPVSEYVTSQGTDTQVTDSKKRVILVKELVTDEAGADTGCPSPVHEEMTALKSLEIKVETTDSFSGQTDRYDGPLSPTYLSVGSDDGSAVEIYYSAEEDNAEASGNEEMYSVDERHEICGVDRVKEAIGVREEFPQHEDITESGISERDEGKSRVVIVKTQNDGDEMDNEEKEKDVNSWTETRQELREEICMVDRVKEEVVGVHEEFPQQEETAERGLSKRDEEISRVVIVKRQNEGDKMGNEEKQQDFKSRTEVHQELREEVWMVDGMKEEVVGVLEVFPQQVEITERGINKRDEEKSRAVIVKMQNEGDEMDTEEKNKNVNSWTQAQQELREEICVVDGGKEEVVGVFEELPQQEKPETAISKRDDEKSKVVIVKMQNKGDKMGNEEKEKGVNSLTEAWQELREEVCMVDRVKEEVVGVHEEFPQQEETAERGLSKRDEEISRVVIVKRQNKGDKMGNEEKQQDFKSRTEVHQELREEVWMVDGMKEEVVGVLEVFPQQVEITERGINKRDEEKSRAVIVKMQNEGDEMDTEEKNKNVNSWTQAQQELREEICVVDGGKEEVVGVFEELPQQEKPETAISKRDDEKSKVIILQMQKEGDEIGNEEKEKNINSRTEAWKDLREEICLVDGVKEEVVGVHEKFLQQREIAESKLSKRDEEKSWMVTVQRQNDGDKKGNKEKEEDVSSPTEVQQELRGQSSEAPMQETGMLEFLADIDAKSGEKEVTVFPQVKEEGHVERKEELPATPVQQVNTVMVCDFAPPSSEPHGQGEVSGGNLTKELETEDPPDVKELLPSLEIQYLAYKDVKSSEYTQAASSDTREEDMITPKFIEAEEPVLFTAETDKICEVISETSETNSNATTTSAVTDTCGGVEVVTGTLTHSAELQSDATEIEHNRAPQSSEWVDTITQSADRTSTAREQVTVELSAPNADAHRPDTEAADALPEKHEHPAEAQPDLNQGSLAASRTPTVSLEVFTSKSQPTDADQEAVDNMNSGFSSLSTKLSVKSLSPPKEDESKNRFRKLSLINDADSTEVGQDAVDFTKTSDTTVTESNGTDFGSEYRWRNRFEGVSQYKLHGAEDSSFSYSPSYRTSDSYSSNSFLSSSTAFPEATAYKHRAFSSYSSLSPPPVERVTLDNRLSDRTEVYLSRESEPAAERKDEWRRSLVEQEEPAAPVGERERQAEGEAERIKSRWESDQLPASGLSPASHTSYDNTDSFKEEDDDSAHFTGVFKATLVELVSDPAAPPSTPPASPDADSTNQFDMDSLVDTLKSMGPSLRPRSTSLRAPPPALVSSLPPIVEDAPSPVTSDVPDSVSSPAKKMEAAGKPAEPLNGLYTLPADLGLKRTAPRDTRSPLELMKQSQQDQQLSTRGLNMPMRASATNSIVMRKPSDSAPEDVLYPVLNGNGVLGSPSASSRLDSSAIFGSYRSASIDQSSENRPIHRPLFRTGSLPETGITNDRMSLGSRELGDPAAGTDPPASRFDRFSFLLNPTSSLTGTDDPNTRMSWPPPLGIGSPPSSNSPTRLLSPTGSIDLHRPSFTTSDSPLSMFGKTQGIGMGAGTGALGTSLLQKSFSSEGTAGVQQTSLFNSVRGGSQFQNQEFEPERNLAAKYRAFPDAYLTKEKEHGKLNPRPGKLYIFDRPGMCGQRIEVRSDVIDATSWELQETISIRVVRGGWVLYEKPNFKGEKIALDEGDIELTYPFEPPEEEQQNGQTEGGEQDGEQNGEQNGEKSEVQTKPARGFIIGSVRRAVRDYSVPEISFFPEENAEGKKVTFRDTSEDARIFGFPIKANSIIINAGLWLVYAEPFFQGVPRVLEVGGYSNPAAWGVEQPYVASLHPLKVGEPRVEIVSEPKMVIYDKPYFTGKSRTITTNVRDFMTRMDRQQTAFMYNVGSLKVQGGIWVGYEKEGFRGFQYLLEEGEYHDWRVWGGCNSELRSVRVIRADLTDPLMVMFEQPEEEQEDMQGNSFEVTEAIPDVELFEYKTSSRSIHVLSGAWVAYSHVDFSGNQYILEKGFYNNCADWGSQDNRICSVQPILLARNDSSVIRNEVKLYSEPDFQGECHVFDCNQEEIPKKLVTKSCRVSGGNWVVYEDKQYTGNLYVLSEGDYSNLTSMGCPPGFNIRSVKVVPLKFSVPSISLFGLECLEGREITTETEILSMVEEGFNNHILSVRVNCGCWVICEHSNFRGRQFLLEPIEITNWPKFSSLQTIGSMYPVRQKRRFFRIKNKESGNVMSVQGGVEEMKSGRVVVAPDVEPMSDIWFYQDGFLKNKLSANMSLQVMGKVEPAAKVVLWTDTRQPFQTWAAEMRGLITSLTFPGLVIDVKGGKSYDKDHVVIMPESEERPSQQWEIELL